MIRFKKQITAFDGSTLEENATKAYDEYNLELAKEWMMSEGYDYSRATTTTSKTSAFNTSALGILILIITMRITAIYKHKK